MLSVDEKKNKHPLSLPHPSNTHTHTNKKHKKGHYTIFGEVVAGLEVLDAVNALSVGQRDNTATREDADTAIFTDTGQLRRGSWAPKLELETSLKKGQA